MPQKAKTRDRGGMTPAVRGSRNRRRVSGLLTSRFNSVSILHDMNDDSAKPRYHSPLRSRQKEQTRDLILNAVDAILRGAPVSEVTIAAVAREADITERTIYRHFPTREDLLNAAWRRALRAFIRGQTQQVETLDQILELTRAAYENFDANEGIVRAIISAPEGVEVRKRPAEIRLDMLRKAYAGLLAGHPRGRR